MKRKISINRSSQAGISLIELMVGLTIGLIITAGALTILFSNQKLILEKDVMDRSQENFRFASMTITRLVRQANELGIPANNNELIVTFDRTQRDCLGQLNNSWINTFKVNANNELLCVLNNDENLSYVLAKDISEIKFSYGIQNGVSANSLVYQPRFSGNSNTENTAVVNAWNTVTSVLTQMTVAEGNGKQPTIDFISTSHLLALTKLASSGGTSHANPSNNDSSNSSSGSSQNGNDSSNGNSSEDGPEENNENPPTEIATCSRDVFSRVKVTYGSGASYWADLSGTNFVPNKSVVSVDISQVNNNTDWQLEWKYNTGVTGEKPFSSSWTTWTSDNLQGNEYVVLTLRCSDQITSSLKFSR
ncbi:PilW family protein [Acinetobacter zhairhuonensis]|uniref:PilW family protein n=1 Tax=Acinetobacter sp. A7.4 TaxID=2919921 RepID=UPI001F4E2B3D|nr:prepilin-type N-terminal cleavage/methylation domain-containing protein [Acinetobacter sp. A7.4]MCJ8161093.1 prepilin-type N-terminal cleavage/methylation domain-containing protein [Acinetobacter sp. A7.4]